MDSLPPPNESCPTSAKSSALSSTRTSHTCEPVSATQPDPSPSLGVKQNQTSSNFGFLCQNVRFLNQPICSLVGEQDKVDHKQQFVAQNVSLAFQITSDAKPNANYTKDSTQRRDFPDFNEIKLQRPVRTPQQPAQGIVPGIGPESGNKKREKISYEHIYDCRTDLNYPPRGKRLGTFV